MVKCYSLEPYAGVASVALSLLLNEYAFKIVINDIDISIYAFWHSVLNKTEALCSLIEKTPVAVSVWDQQRLVEKNPAKHSLLVSS